ncbi:MAG TPA: hypothetical protein PLH72_04850 [Vicinamibacterales bacterium]|nr:hypothetical protein [Vicinamibacterales bacterium]HQZ38347.1 hypothetical protein [Vicinamibacterales bacterium]
MRELKAVGVDGVKLIYSDNAHTGRPALPVMRPEIMRAMMARRMPPVPRHPCTHPTWDMRKKPAGVSHGSVHSVADAPVADEFIALMREKDASYTTPLVLYTSFTDVSAWMRKLIAADHRKVAPLCTENLVRLHGLAFHRLAY